ncbi:LysR family transcriptional regulator [Sphingobium sp. CR2-8]|uniref:LysR family transcriptional regulator n=1 Tax=Sphingobium sp. CR2-8 TaxID=1306534 RepID=UPI002DBD0CBB|nr:LysR family transcriptional regulator [Sphingobium sp. CR2-8]MEC3909671.1 LysR family transcriptional regulator [Sphingobium sp. CR2-8]
MIEIRHLHYVIATAELGSFSQAAESLRIKQSTLSQRIRHLEQRLGTDLFERSTRGARLTRAGDHFISGARQLVADLDSLHRNTIIFGQGRRGALKLGLSGAVPSSAVQSLMLEFSKRHVDIQLSAAVCDRQALVRDFERGQLDAIIVAGHLAPPGAAYHAIGSSRLFAVMVHDNPLALRAPLFWSDLRDLTLLLADSARGDDLLSQIAGRLTLAQSQAGLDRAAIVRSPLNLNGLYQLIDTGCFTIVQERAFARLPPHLVVLPIHEPHGHARIDFGLCWREDASNPALAPLLRTIMTVAEKPYRCDALQRRGPPP